MMINHFLGSRDAVRLAETSVGWLHEFFGQKTITIFHATLQLKQFEVFFADVDRAISLALPLSRLGWIQKRCSQLIEDESAYRITTLVIETLHFFSETAAAIECLGWIGVVVLSPCVEGLAFTASTFACLANLIDFSQKVYDNYLIYHAPTEYKAFHWHEGLGEPSLKVEWSKNLCEMIADLAQFSTDFFKGLAYFYGLRSMTPTLHRFWRTSAAVSHSIRSYLDSKG
ncbi:MAG: hypothetical protein H7A42_01220 [Chlamydiales bacterium]|nr:hypothetical protein [Chlamydiales bacterium]